MSHPITLLRLEHNQAEELLKTIELELEQEQPFELTLLQTVLDYFADYPDQCHHPIEDLVYRKMLARDPNAAAPVSEILEDHEKLSALTQSAVSILKAAENDDVHNETLKNELQQFVDYYRSHMQAEEEHFFPLAINTLTKDDWFEIDHIIFDQSDPLYDHAAESRFRGLRDKIKALGSKSYERIANLREAKQLRQLTSIEAFNEMMTEAGHDYRIVNQAEGGYTLEHHAEIIIDIPECSPTRAAWCAYFYVKGATKHQNE